MDQWAKISERFNEWAPPLRPSSEDVDLFRFLGGTQGRVLLLGVTPELQGMATVAVDHNPRVIEIHRARAVLGDWADLPFEHEFDTVIGDGCLNIFQGSVELFFQQMKKVLKKGGRLVLRVFISPETKEDLSEVLAAGEGMGFHAFKWRVAHAIANPYVRVKDLCGAIQDVYDHPTLEVYRTSDLIYYFPKLSELPTWDEIEYAHSYELAERCPIIMWQF